MAKAEDIPNANPTDGQCSYVDSPPAYTDAAVPQPFVVAAVPQPVVVAAVPQQPQENVWAYELFYCFRDLLTCFTVMSFPCVAEVSQ